MARHIRHCEEAAETQNWKTCLAATFRNLIFTANKFRFKGYKKKKTFWLSGQSSKDALAPKLTNMTQRLYHNGWSSKERRDGQELFTVHSSWQHWLSRFPFATKPTVDIAAINWQGGLSCPADDICMRALLQSRFSWKRAKCLLVRFPNWLLVKLEYY